MEKILTAEEFRLSKLIDSSHKWTEEEIMIEFAKLHVTAALESAYNNQVIQKNKKRLNEYDYADESHFEASKNSIINSYPLDKIK